MSRRTFFQRISSALTVGEIATELVPPVPADSTFEDVNDAVIDASLYGKEDWFCLVKDGEHYLGYTCPDSDRRQEAEETSKK